MSNTSAIVVSVHYDISAAQLQEIQHLRYHIYSEEMGLPLANLDHARQLLPDSLDREAIHITASTGDALVGAIRLNRNAMPADLEDPLEADLLPRPYFYCARLHVRPDYRGSGVMRSLAEASFAEFSRRNAAVAVCHCHRALARLYRPLGFRPYGVAFCLPGLEYLGPQTPLRCESQVWQVPRAA